MCWPVNPHVLCNRCTHKVDIQLQTLQAQVQRREEEIERLGHLLEGGRPVDSVRAESESKREERRLGQLNTQVEYLQETNKALENELVGRNFWLEWYRGYAPSCAPGSTPSLPYCCVARSPRRCLGCDKYVLTDGVCSRERHYQVMTTSENEELSIKVVELQARHSEVVKELGDFDRLSRELQQEKLAAKAESQREVRKDKMLLSRQKAQLADKMARADALQNHNEKLIGENQHLVGMLTKSEREVERLQIDNDRIIEDNRFLASRRGPDGADGPTAGTLPNDTYTASTGADMAAVADELAATKAAYARLQELYMSIESEREFYKREYDKFQAPPGATREEHSGSGSSSSRLAVSQSAKSELARFQLDIRLLTETVQRLELQLNDAGAEISALETEKANALMLYNQAMADVSHNRSHVSGHLGQVTPHPPVVTVVQKGSATEEIDELKSTVVQLRDRLKAAEVPSDDSLKVDQLEAMLRESRHVADAATKKAEHAEILAKELTRKPAMVGQWAQTELPGEPAQLAGLETIAQKDAVIRELRMALQDLDRERDNLQAEVDEQAEATGNLQQALDLRAGEWADAQNSLLQLRGSLDDAGRSLEGKDREIDSMRRQLTQKEADCSDYYERCKNQEEQNRRLEEDLNNMARENQAVHTDLNAALETRNELEQNLRDYVDKMMYIEHMLKQKEEEKEALLNSYKSLSSSASEAHSQASLASQAHAEAKMELQSKDHLTFEMQAQLQSLDAESKALTDQLQATEGRNTSLIDELQQSQFQSASGLAQVVRLEEELQAARDLSAMASKGRDDLQRRCAQVEAEAERLKKQLRDAGRVVSAHDQLADTAGAQNANLERMLSDARKGLAENEKQLKQEAAEKAALKRSLKDLTERAREMGQTMNQLAQSKAGLEDRVQALEKEVTNARYQAVTTSQHAPPSRERASTPSPARSGDS